MAPKRKFTPSQNPLRSRHPLRLILNGFWKVLDLNGTSTFSHITNHGKGRKEPSKSVCKTTLEKTLLRSGNGIRWSQPSLSPVELPL